MKTSNSSNMIINSQDLAQIQALAKHEVAFPNINYTNFENLNLRKTTILAAYTNINFVVPEYLPESLNGLEWKDLRNIDRQNEMLGFLHAEILSMINNVDMNNDHELTKIFIYIQLWGGNTGRGPFVRGGGFGANFNVEQYRLGIIHVREGQHLEALGALNGIKYISTAFSTKHMHFWSNGELPIYDSVIAKLVFGRDFASENHYAGYNNALDDLIQELRQVHNQTTTRRKIERSLFNWASTIDGGRWNDIRVPRPAKK